VFISSMVQTVTQQWNHFDGLIARVGFRVQISLQNYDCSNLKTQYFSWSILTSEEGKINDVEGQVEFDGVQGCSLLWHHIKMPSVFVLIPGRFLILTGWESNTMQSNTTYECERERERFTSSPTFLCGNTPATLG